MAKVKQLPATTEHQPAPPQLPANYSAKLTDFAMNAAPLAPVMSLQDAGDNFERTKAFIACNLSLKSGDIYVLPTSPKPVLAKSGAEKLAAFFSCVPEYDVLRHVEDWNRTHPSGVNAPYFLYEIVCRLKWRANGLQVGEGMGLCHSWESKYLWREGKRLCPVCGEAKLQESKPEYGGGFYCYKKLGGCGAAWKEFESTDYHQNVIQPSPEDVQMVAQLRAQATGRVINPDIGDIMNTVFKMAQKRSLAPAVITALGIGGLFTQDLEDWSEYDAAAAGSARTATEDALETMRKMGILNPEDTIDVEHTEVTEEQKASTEEAKAEPPKRTRTRKPAADPAAAKSVSNTDVTEATTVTPTPEPGTQDTQTTTATPPNGGAAIGAVHPPKPSPEPTKDEIAAFMSAKNNGNYSNDDVKVVLKANYGNIDGKPFTQEMCLYATKYMSTNPLKKAAAHV